MGGEVADREYRWILVNQHLLVELDVTLAQNLIEGRVLHLTRIELGGTGAQHHLLVLRLGIVLEVVPDAGRNCSPWW